MIALEIRVNGALREKYQVNKSFASTDFVSIPFVSILTIYGCTHDWYMVVGLSIESWLACTRPTKESKNHVNIIDANFVFLCKDAVNFMYTIKN